MSISKELVQAFIESDRQWTRELRVAHAKFMLSEAVGEDDKEFWKAVLERLLP